MKYAFFSTYIAESCVLVLWFLDDPTIFPTVAVGTFVIILGIPFLAVGGVALYSKITDERTQGSETKLKSA